MPRLAELMVADRERNPSQYSVVLVSEGARMEHEEDMSFESAEMDQYGHRKLGGMGDKVAASLRDFSVGYGKGRRIDVINQRLGYLVRSGDPDALDSIVPMAFGNLALEEVGPFATTGQQREREQSRGGPHEAGAKVPVRRHISPSQCAA